MKKAQKAQNPIGREEATRKLKAFAKVGLAGTQAPFGEALFQETDRGAIILLATAVEDQLTARILRDMVDLSADEFTRLFGADAPIGTFSSKIKLAYALGYIDRDVVKMCDLLREMRNACAHSRRAISFANAELRDVLRVLMTYLTDEETFTSTSKPLVLRLVVTWATGWLVRAIRTGSHEEATESINRLIAEANAMAVEARSSPKKRRARSTPKSPSSRKDSQR